MGKEIVVWAALGLFISGATVALAHPPASPIVAPSGVDDGYDQVQQLIELINQARWDNGQLPPLKRAFELDAAAEGHSQDMSDHDFFDHVGSDGLQFSERMQAADYVNQLWTAENIGAGQTDAYTVMWDPTYGWMSSGGHRDNILATGAREMGAGHVYEPGDTYPHDQPWAYQHYWTLNLGARQGVYPVVINREAYSTTSRAVSLYLYGAGWAQEMRFNNDGGSWSDWETFAADKSWDLNGGSGTKTVWAQIRRDADTKTISDTIILDDPLPALSAEPVSLTFLAQQGSGTSVPAAHSLSIRNAGGGELDWTVSPQETWIDASPLTGSGDAATSIWLQNLGSLGLGVHTGTVLVGSDSPGVQNSPQTVTVTLSIVDELHFVYLPLVSR